MKPVLYIDNRSPPVRSCLMLIKLLNIDIDLKLIDIFKGEQLQDSYKKINPAHTVPTLIDDDLILTDSKTILIHLCEKYEKSMNTNNDHAIATLWPKDYKQRMQILNILFFEGTVLFRRDSDLMSEIVRKSFANIEMDYHQRKIFDVYNMLEQYLTHNSFIASNEHMTIADLAVITTLSTLDLIFSVYTVTATNDNKWPNLCKWFDRMKALPIYDINWNGLMELKTSIELYGKFQITMHK